MRGGKIKVQGTRPFEAENQSFCRLCCLLDVEIGSLCLAGFGLGLVWFTIL
jgi:hypothetical protein